MPHFFLGASALLMTNHHHRPVIDSGEATDECLIICIQTVTVQLIELGEYVFDIIQRVRPQRVSGNL